MLRALRPQPHRLDGPAIKKPDGSLHWYVEGKRHRADGPAVVHADGTHEWWLDGRQVSKRKPAMPAAMPIRRNRRVPEWAESLSLLTSADTATPRNAPDANSKIRDAERKSAINSGRMERIRRIALKDRVEYRNRRNKLHCADGAAVEWRNGDKEY